MCACLSVCLSARPSICPSVCLCVRLSVRTPACLSVLPSICVSVNLSVSLSIHLPVCPSTCLPVCLSVYPSVRPPVYPSIQPSDRPFPRSTHPALNTAAPRAFPVECKSGSPFSQQDGSGRGLGWACGGVVVADVAEAHPPFTSTRAESALPNLASTTGHKTRLRTARRLGRLLRCPPSVPRRARRLRFAPSIVSLSPLSFPLRVLD